ncbi:MAG TPA: hypothetical protein VH142_21155 [Polyangiaceae bacterium]|nr:hypothetical protein [Polyangiaceae bacterium]
MQSRNSDLIAIERRPRVGSRGSRAAFARAGALCLASVLGFAATASLSSPAKAQGVQVDVGLDAEAYPTAPPPDPIPEDEPVAPALGYSWVPGYWDWTGYDWEWNVGYWSPQRAGYLYVGPRFVWEGEHLVYYRSYWRGPDGHRDFRYGGGRVAPVAWRAHPRVDPHTWRREPAHSTAWRTAPGAPSGGWRGAPPAGLRHPEAARAATEHAAEHRVVEHPAEHRVAAHQSEPRAVRQQAEHRAVEHQVATHAVQHRATEHAATERRAASPVAHRAAPEPHRAAPHAAAVRAAPPHGAGHEQKR